MTIPVPFDPDVQAVLDEIAKNPQPALTRETLPRDGVEAEHSSPGWLREARAG